MIEIIHFKALLRNPASIMQVDPIAWVVSDG